MIRVQPLLRSQPTLASSKKPCKIHEGHTIRRTVKHIYLAASYNARSRLSDNLRRQPGPSNLRLTLACQAKPTHYPLSPPPHNTRRDNISVAQDVGLHESFHNGSMHSWHTGQSHSDWKRVYIAASRWSHRRAFQPGFLTKKRPNHQETVHHQDNK